MTNREAMEVLRLRRVKATRDRASMRAHYRNHYPRDTVEHVTRQRAIRAAELAAVDRHGYMPARPVAPISLAGRFQPARIGVSGLLLD